MVRYAVGYRSRAFVTFGRPIPLDGFDYQSRRSVLDLAHLVRSAIARLYKVLPTSLVAAAMRPSISRAELTSRVGALIDTLAASNANLGVTRADEAVDMATELLEGRGIVVLEGGRLRVRERNVLRYYARNIEHLLSPAGSTH
jgi:hypothetical protein